ncbi:barstar family protein [Micromonospora sp. CPCC 205546]|uniref:barstar family protein n=1 Tax=Micromonospora sp. CPCC 205546 TaxID=3122397 RepID=UPI002FF21D59
MTDDWWHRSADQLAVCSRSAVVELTAVLPATGRFVVVHLDATRMSDADHAFHEFSDALLFPSYFGWNWAALSECLRDLNWLPADGYLIVVDNAPRLLSDGARDRDTLFQILSQAVHYWASPLGRPNGNGVPFKVLLLCDLDEEAALLRQEIASAVHNLR